MDVFEAVKKRRSVRNFKQVAIPENLQNKLIEALNFAPSAGNLQSRKFYFVEDKAKKEKIAKASLSQNFVAEAPLVVVGCADKDIEKFYRKRGSEIYTICDVAVSVENMLLQATELGLGSCWVGAFEEEEIKKTLDIPDNLWPIVVVPIGFPDKIPPASERKEKGELIEYK